MNRAVEHYYKDLGPKHVGYLVIFVMQHFEESYEINKEHYDKLNTLANPLELAKFGLRTYSIWDYKGERVSLLDLRKTDDPLEVIEYSRFSGKFSYDKRKKAYRPLWCSVKGTKVMKKIYNKIDEKRIERTWEKVQKYLSVNDVEELKLHYDPDD